MRTAFVSITVLALAVGLNPAAPASAQQATASQQSVVAKKKPKAKSRGSLSVQISKPKSLPVTVTVRGGGQRKTLKRTATLRGLKPGKYTVTTSRKRVRTKQGTYYAAKVRQSVRVKRGKRSTAAVFYGFRPKSTLVKPASRLTLLGGDPAGGARFNVKGPVQKGDVIVSAPGSEFPDGVLVKVTSVKKNTVTTVPATLTDAIPAGQFSQSSTGSVVIDEGSSLAGVPDDSRSPFWKKIKCEASGDASLQGVAEAQISVTMDSGWGGWVPKPWLEIRGDASAGANITLTVAGYGQCTLPRSSLLAQPIQLPQVKFSLYGVPVWINNSLQFYLEGKANATASLSTAAGVSMNTNAGARIGKDARTWFNPPTVEKTFTPPTASAKADGEIWLGADVQSLVYGQVGGALGVDIGPKLVVDSQIRPWWTLSLQARGTARLTSNVPGLKGEHRFPQIGYFSTEIANSGGSEPDSSGSGDSGGADAVRHINFYDSDELLRCALYTVEDEHGEFYGSSTGEDNACGTFLSVDGELYGPPDIPARTDFGSAWIPVSRTTGGTGSATDPYVATTVVTAGTTGISLEQTDSWVDQSDTVSTKLRVRNYTGAPKTVRLTRAADCYIGDSDVGTGELSVSGGYAGCLRTSSLGLITLRLQALGDAPTVAEARFSEIWDMVDAQTDLPNTCRCDEEIDNGVAVSWLVNVPAGSSRLRTSEFSLRRP